MFTKLFNKINQSLIVESLLSAEIDTLKEPKQDRFTDKIRQEAGDFNPQRNAKQLLNSL